MVTTIMLEVAAWASTLRSSIANRLADEHGQDLIEYAVLAGAIGVVAAGLLFVTPLSSAISDFSTKVAGCIDLSTGGC